MFVSCVALPVKVSLKECVVCRCGWSEDMFMCVVFYVICSSVMSYYAVIVVYTSGNDFRLSNVNMQI